MTNPPPKPGEAGRAAYLAEGNAKQARKRVSADVLLWDDKRRLLLVKPTYKDGWDLPGGMAEANEKPKDAARREILEELGLKINTLQLACVDWVAPHDQWDDLLAFIFDGGHLSKSRRDLLSPQDDELSSCAFFTTAQALSLLRHRTHLRLQQALEALNEQAPRYLENGTP